MKGAHQTVAYSANESIGKPEVDLAEDERHFVVFDFIALHVLL